MPKRLAECGRGCTGRGGSGLVRLVRPCSCLDLCGRLWVCARYFSASSQGFKWENQPQEMQRLPIKTGLKRVF